MFFILPAWNWIRSHYSRSLVWTCRPTPAALVSCRCWIAHNLVQGSRSWIFLNLCCHNTHSCDHSSVAAALSTSVKWSLHNLWRHWSFLASITVIPSSPASHLQVHWRLFSVYTKRGCSTGAAVGRTSVPHYKSCIGCRSGIALPCDTHSFIHSFIHSFL